MRRSVHHRQGHHADFHRDGEDALRETPEDLVAERCLMAGIASLDQLEPGDIMIAGQSEAPAKLLVYGGQLLMGEQFRIGKFVAGHAGVVVPPAVVGGQLRLVEAMPHGARIRNLQASDWCPQQAYFRLPDDYPGQHLDAAAVAMAMVDTPYSIASYAYLAAWRFHFRTKELEARINRRRPGTAFILPSGRWTTDNLPYEAICSVLADQAWTLTGKKVVDQTAPQVVTPGMLTQQLWFSSNVMRGGVGIL